MLLRLALLIMQWDLKHNTLPLLTLLNEHNERRRVDDWKFQLSGKNVFQKQNPRICAIKENVKLRKQSNASSQICAAKFILYIINPLWKRKSI